jgi:hypothetical protein
MIEWWTLTVVTLALASGVWSLVSGIRGFAPRDSTVLSTAGIALLLIIQMVVSIVQPILGNPPVGDGLEFWLYLIIAFAMIIAVVLWALVDRTRYATIGMGMVAVAVAVMMLRMSIIWTGS